MKQRTIFTTLAGILIGGAALLAVLNRNSTLTGNILNRGTSLWDGLPVTPPADGALCGPTIEGNWATWDEMKAMSQPIVTGIAAGNWRGDFQSIGYWTFEAPPDMPIQTRFNVWYPLTDQNIDPLVIRVVVLLDDLQVQNSIRTNTPNLALSSAYYDARFVPGDDKEFILRLGPLKPGIHDLLILLLRNIEQSPDSRGHISYGDMRLTIFVPGASSQTQRQFHTRLEPVKYRASGASGAGLVVGLNGEGPSTWNWPQNTFSVPAKQDALRFYSWLGYLTVTDYSNEERPVVTPDHDQPVRLFVFLDYVLSQDIDNPVSDVLLPANSEVSVFPHELKIPSELGQHDILVVRLNYPGVPVCRLEGGRQGTSFANTVHMQRVAITVQ